MKINFYTTEPENVHFNISDYSSKVEIAQRIQELLGSKYETDLNFVLKPPIKGNVSIPDVIQVLSNYKQNDATVNIIVANEDIIQKLKKYFPSDTKFREEILLGKDLELLLEIKTGDITEEFCDAIVNASNTLLKLGSGVSGAIRDKAGESLQTEMTQIASNRKIQNGGVVITGSHELRTCKFIIHAASADGTKETLKKAILNTLEICNEKQIKSVAFPALSTGVGGMSKSEFGRIFIKEVSQFADEKNKSLQRISLVLWSSSDFEEINEVIKSF